MIETLVALVLLFVLFAARRQAVCHMLLVRPGDSGERLLAAAEEGRPAVVVTEVLSIILVVGWLTHWSGVDMPVRLGIGAVLLVFGLLIAQPSGREEARPTPAWIAWIARVISPVRHKEPAATAREPEKSDPLDERLLLDRMLRFRQRDIADVMVPRSDIVGIDATSDVAAVLDLIEEHRHSRYPVYEGDLDHVVGMVNVLDLLALPSGSREIGSLIHQVLMVPEGKGCDDLLSEMSVGQQEFAIVVDEFGGTAGLVTSEDLMEELVGEIWDEHEREAVIVRRVGRNVYVAEATVTLAEVAEHLDLQLPEGDYETLAGFLLEEFGRIPVRGDTVTWEGTTFEILTADRRKIGSVKIVIAEAGDS